jgi:hypothetical protein
MAHVHANLFARRLHHFLNYKPHQRQRAHRRGVTGRIADNYGSRTATDRRRIKSLHRFRIAAARILGNEHRIETERNRIFHGLFSSLQKEIIRPALSESSDWTGTDKSRCLDR